jgi:Fic family protein
MPTRPKDENELQKREAAGVIRASRFVRQYAHSRKPITLSTVYEIHKCIFQEAWTEIAGVCRIEELKISDSQHRPPHHTKVENLMKALDNEFKHRLEKLSSVESFWVDDRELSEKGAKIIDNIIATAAWIHHQITYVHPFREGNGRTARLAGNLILERYGLVGISIKVERENKNRYRAALAQIDSHGDYEPLKELIYDGLIDRYNGLSIKYLKTTK